MTLGLDRWLHMFARFVPRRAVPRPIPRLDLSRLPDRDIADLNLPRGLLTEFEARQAEEMRRRIAR